MDLRQPTQTHIDALADIWFTGWHQAHAGLLPDELVQARTLESFAERCRLELSDIRTAVLAEDVCGFFMVKDDELAQIFVRSQVRGTGIAAGLLENAERQMRSAGIEMAWLDCVIGNERAARFYEKHGWQRRKDNAFVTVDIPSGPREIEVWRYQKRLVR